MDFTIYAGPAHPPGDQLRHLTPEIDDEYPIGHCNFFSTVTLITAMMAD